ncbi:MAG: peptidylprolyl isomerase [Bacteroidales bacterium]|jgi:peptidyl-prolyl cis-trans isomerase B (cyclophilin B)|nr:peptidylprolyl isomerase [Bacteroidales bacterium]
MTRTTFLSFIAFLMLGFSTASAQNSKNMETKETIVLLKTTMGDMKIKLYNETPLHRDNFIKLVNQKFYDGLLFHRVIKNFMIQAGDPESKNAPAGKRLGSGGPGYTIAAEILPQLKHKKGAVAAARLSDQINPQRESSGSQFYIVQSAPHLDGDYTVFGEVIEGLDILDKIANVKTAPGDRPIEDVKIISATIVK